jgi:hypothetical protein
MIRMWKRDRWRAFIDHPVVEWAMFVVGILLLIAALIVGPLPGPGGVFFAVPGLILVLKSSMWARRHYVKFKRWRPKIFGRRLTPGRWTDLALRRQSALRREAIRKEQKSIEKRTGQPTKARTNEGRIN